MSERPRVLLINYEFPPLGGGAGTATAGMARALAQLGCDVVVLTSRFRDLPSREQTEGYTIHRVRVLRRRADRCTPFEMTTFMASASVAAARLTRRWRPELTIAFFGIPGGPVAWIVRALRGSPYIISLRGGDVPGFDCAPGISLYHRAATPALRFLWRRAVAVVANGSGLRELAERLLPGLRVHLVPNGVDAERHSPASGAARHHSVPRLLFVGRLAYQKAADVLLHALARMRERPFVCDIVGDGPDRDALERLAQTLGIAERVRFRGWARRDELPSHYDAADIFVLPSRMEGMPNAVLESMAHALPVVATDVPGTRELVRAGSTGLLVNADDAQALSDAVATLLDDAALRRRMGDAARALVLAEYTWQGSAAAYLRLGGIPLPAARAAEDLPRTAGAR